MMFLLQVLPWLLIVVAERKCSVAQLTVDSRMVYCTILLDPFEVFEDGIIGLLAEKVSSIHLLIEGQNTSKKK